MPILPNTKDESLNKYLFAQSSENDFKLDQAVKGYLPRLTETPTADKTNRKRLVLVETTAADDEIKVCRKKADGGYEWFNITGLRNEIYDHTHLNLPPTITATFTRSSVAYNADGTQVVANVPRFEAGKFGQGLLVEAEGTTNKLINAPLADSNADGLADSWIAASAGALSCVGGVQTFTATAQFGAIYQNYDLGVGVVSGPWACSTEIKGLNGRIIVYLYDANLAYLGNFASSIATDDQNFKKFTCISTRTDVRKVVFRIEDNRVSGWTPISFRKPQLEQGKSYVTSFTDGTRSAETLTIPTAGIFDKDEGSIEVVITPKTVQGFNNFFNTSISTGRFLLFFNTSGSITWDYGPGNSGLAAPNGTAITNQPVTIGLGWSKATGKRWLVVNGQSIGEQAFTPPDSFPATLSVVNNYSALIDDLRFSSPGRTTDEMIMAYQSNLPLLWDANTTLKLDFDGYLDTAIRAGTNRVWHEGNDGAGSGLAADILSYTTTVPADTPQEGTTRIVNDAGVYYLYTYVGGAWRKVQLT